MNEGSILVDSGAESVAALSDVSESYSSQFQFEQVEQLARVIIAETGEWKESLERRGPMVVTCHGREACEITLPKNAHHPDWVFQRRMLTESEKASFEAEYGRSGHYLILGQQMGTKRQIRGFILNGRLDGWQLSVGE